LYIQVTPWGFEWNNDDWGNWSAPGLVTDRPGAFRNGGPTFRDIKVGRRIAEGEALIYHIQIQGAIVPDDTTFHMNSWLRVLIREG